jgi:hypothetical protein
MKSGRYSGAVLAIWAWLAMAGCSWDNQEEFYPTQEGCDTLDVSFSMDVQPLLSQNCLSCHSNSNAPNFGAGVRLESHADVAQRIPLIVSVINHEEGFPQMPRGAEKLDSCSIATFEAWENQGSKDN